MNSFGSCSWHPNAFVLVRVHSLCGVVENILQGGWRAPRPGPGTTRHVFVAQPIVSAFFALLLARDLASATTRCITTTPTPFNHHRRIGEDRLALHHAERLLSLIDYPCRAAMLIVLLCTLRTAPTT